LEQIDFPENMLISWDICRYHALIEYSYPDNKLTDIDLSDNVKLEDVYLSHNHFLSMNIKKFSHLKQLQKLIISIYLLRNKIDNV
jgi:hypothetical protein